VEGACVCCSKEIIDIPSGPQESSAPVCTYIKSRRKKQKEKPKRHGGTRNERSAKKLSTGKE
jgi:hypothetical protein